MSKIYMSKKNLKQFDPNRVAKFETGMWHAYYHHNPLKLFYLLVRLAREFFGVNYFIAIRMGYYAVFAAVDFKLNKGNENQTRIIKKLTKFYKLIFNHSLESFEYKKAAHLELEWWLVDRYPDCYSVSREEALARGMAVIFNVDYSRLSEYARYRAEAMVIQDDAEINCKEADWQLIGSLLQKSFTSLSAAVK